MLEKHNESISSDTQVICLFYFNESLTYLYYWIVVFIKPETDDLTGLGHEIEFKYFDKNNLV
jgi:hypothetical protein